jgi:hypothetical protein
MADVDPVRERIRAKHAKKQEYKAAVYRGEIEPNSNPLVLDRLPNGLYTVSWKTGGVLPEELKGKHTSLAKLRHMVMQRYGEDILV